MEVNIFQTCLAIRKICNILTEKQRFLGSSTGILHHNPWGKGPGISFETIIFEEFYEETKLENNSINLKKKSRIYCLIKNDNAFAYFWFSNDHSHSYIIAEYFKKYV